MSFNLKKSILPIVVSILVMLCLYLLMKQVNPKQKNVYINNVQLFNGFGMSIDLGRKHKSEIESNKKAFDSLLTIYKIFVEQNNESKTKELEGKLRQKEALIEQQENYLKTEVSQKVWKRLNGYIKSYGKEKGYEFIFGTQGNGNVMYAEEDLDITEEILEYANAKYEGY